MTAQELTSPSDILKEKMQVVFDKELYISILNLCTSDGFDIYSLSRNQDIEPDKVAAIASTLCSISSASAKQISQGGFNIATVESQAGTLLFLSSTYLGKETVLCVAATEKVSLGTLRFYAQSLATEIENI